MCLSSASAFQMRPLLQPLLLPRASNILDEHAGQRLENEQNSEPGQTKPSMCPKRNPQRGVHMRQMVLQEALMQWGKHPKPPQAAGTP